MLQIELFQLTNLLKINVLLSRCKRQQSAVTRPRPAIVAALNSRKYVNLSTIMAFCMRKYSVITVLPAASLLADVLGLRGQPRHSVYSCIGRDLRSNKGTILKASCDYIRHLRRETTKMKAVEEDSRQKDQTNRKLLLRIQVSVRTYTSQLVGAAV